MASTVPDEVALGSRNSFAIADGRATTEKRMSVSLDAEGAVRSSTSVVDLEKYPPPTDEERSTLRKVADSIPRTSYILCIVEFAERGSYYGVQTVFNNFMQFPLPRGGNGAGAPPKGSEETAGE